MVSEQHREAMRKYEQTEKGKATRYKIMRRYDKTHRLENKARQYIRSAIFRGKIKRPTICENCGGNSQIQGHHADYSKPKEVQWLCRKCHRDADADRELKTSKCPLS